MKRRKGIQSKLRRRIVLVGLISFFVSLLISLLVWMPSMRARALKAAENGNEEIISRMDSTVDFVDSFTENLALSVQQNAEISKIPNPSLTGAVPVFGVVDAVET